MRSRASTRSSFGSFDQLAENWNELVTFQDGIIWTWLGNSVLYSGVALADHAHRDDSRRLRARA